MSSTIKCECVTTLAAICAGLVKEGVQFNARWSGSDRLWTITLTGGF
jgi:hypothetical protein